MRQGMSLAAIGSFMIMLLSSCEVVGGLIKFGIWVGIIIVVLVVAVILWILRKIRK